MSDRVPISVTVLTFNEEGRVRDCLESVKWADEIIVVDSLSTDGTLEIVKEYTDRIVQRPWPGYVEQKQFALEQATHEWLLNVDADERVSPELAQEIRNVVREDDPSFAGWTMPRKTFYLGRWITRGGWYPDRKLRLVRRTKARWEGVEPHDRVVVDGPVGRLRGDLHHLTYRDMADHLKRINRFTTAAACEMDERGKRFVRAHMLLNPIAKFLKMYLLRLGFLDGQAGFVIAVLSSYYVFLKYAKLWERRRAARRGS